jgi:transglutaminase-like putative cysteine protease
LAMCLLAGAASLALGRVFSVRSASWKLLAVAISSALLACALERRGLLLATICSAGALLVAVGLLVFPSSTFHGLPTLQTMHAIADASRLIGQQARDQAAPTLPLQPLLLAAMTAAWAAVFSCHALAFRAGSPVLALLPPVALVAFADSVLSEGVRPLYALAFLVGALALVFADGLRRVRRWGPVWSGSTRSGGISATAGRGARRVATATMVVAAIAPLLVPGFGSKAVLDFGTVNGNRVDIDPLVRVGSMLNLQQPQDVFVVTTTQPTYYKMLSLTHFDGDGWTYNQDPARAAITDGVVPDPNVVVPDPAKINTSVFAVSNLLDFTWLATPYPTTHIDVPGVTVAYDAGDSALVLAHALDARATYTAQWVPVAPDPANLQKLGIFPDQPPASDYIQLPPNLQPQIAALAHQLTDAKTNTFDKVLAIRDYLTSSAFTYDNHVPRVDGADALVHFLITSHRGFCQQFSAAMAAMLRTLGIPARVAVGFAPGRSNGIGNEWQVTTQDAHSWVEVLFPTYGWLTFDPTPSHGVQADTLSSTYSHDPTSVTPHCLKDPKSGKCKPQPPPVGPGQGGTHCPAGRCGRNIAPQLSSSPIPPPARKWLTPRKELAIASLLALLGFALVPVERRVRRRLRLRRSGDHRRVVLTAYNVFAERIAELGFPRGPGETPDEYRTRLLATAPSANGNLDLLTRIAVSSAYSSDVPDLADARSAKDSAQAAWHDMRKATSFWQRVTGAYRRGG